MRLQKSCFAVFTLLTFLLIPFLNVHATGGPTNEGVATVNEVFVVYNSSYVTDSNSDGTQDSLEIANYYKTIRGIPVGNVAGVAMPTTEAITRSDYNTYVKTGIESALTNAGVSDTIKYIVLVKGVPLKIYDTSGIASNYQNYTGNYASVDSSVTLLYQSYSIDSRVHNPYYDLDDNFDLTYRFKTNTFIDTGYGGDIPTETFLKYLVTRLDGYTVANVKSMIDRAYNADTSGVGYNVISGYNTTGWTYLNGSGVASVLSGMGKNFHPNPYSSSSAITTAPGSVIAYTSYGKYSALANDYYNTALNFSYLNGAVAVTYESFSAYAMTSPVTFTDHGQLADFIKSGGTGGIGSVYEPYSDSIASEEIWMPAYAAGYTWADAAYMSLPYLDWQQIVLGDPLMRVNIDIVVPTVTTGAGSSITDTGLSLSGEVTSTGGQSNLSQGFEYGLTTDYDQSVSTNGTFGTGAFSLTLSNLTCNSTYHYRAYSVNTTGTGYGSDDTFTTSACVNPGVSISSASSITTTTATLNGAITENGANTPTIRGFNYGTTNSYGSTSSTTGSYSAGSYTANITGLSCNTTYHYRSFATSTSGTGYSNDLAFTTSPCLPTTTTGASSSVTGTTATLSGKITATGGINPTVRGFQYGLTLGYGSITVENGYFVASSLLTYTANITGLTCESVYHYRSYATNTTGTSYGSDSTFTTGACVDEPTVTTESSSSVTATTVTLSGDMTANGGENATARGFNYGLTTNYGSTTSENGNFNSTLGYLAQFGSSGVSDGQFAYPRDVAIDSLGNIYVADRENHRIQKFDSDGVYVTQWGSFGTGNGQFKYPRGVAIDSSDNIYVADTDNYRVQKFTSSGVYITKWGNYSSGNGGLKYVSDIMIDSSDNVYVSDLYDNYRVNKFNTSGTYVTKWGSGGSGNSQFNVPYALAADSLGNVYVVDSGNHRVQKFTSAGVYVSQFGTYGSGNGQFNSPSGIAIDSSDNIYVSDSGNHRVQKFDSSFNYLVQFGTYGSGNGQFNNPQDIAIDLSGNIYIADYANQRIQKFAGSAVFSANLTGLTCGTTYHYRAYSTNSGGNGYGADDVFTTSACDTPAMSTSSASNITRTTVTLNGSITNIGLSSPTVRGFNYGPDSNYGTTTTENGSFNTGAYTTDITGLTCGTTYHFNAYAINGTGTGSSPDDTFTTSDCPDITAPVISEVTAVPTPAGDTTPNYTFTTNEAGTITYGGSCGSATTSATVGSNTVTFNILSYSTYSNCTITVTDASLNISNTINVTSFIITDTTNPSVSSFSPTDGATGVSALSNLVIVFDEIVTVQTGSITIKKTSDNSTVEVINITSGQVTGTGTSTITINPATTLDLNTGYYVQIASTAIDDSAGNGFAGISNTTTWNFTTGSNLTPSVSTLAASYNNSSVTLNGSISILGGANATVRGFNYGATTGYGSTTTESGSFGSGSYSAIISNLNCGTYHYRAYVTNEYGTNYGSNMTFSASTCPTQNDSNSGGGGGFFIDNSVLVSMVTSSPSKTGVIITWLTNKEASSMVSYGKTLPYTNNTNEINTATRTKNHKVSIDNLACGTTYRYKVISKDSSLNTSNDIDNVFTTTPCSSTQSGQFIKNLKYKDSDPEVKKLQEFLNKNGYVIAKSGAGSPGKESNYFGLATKKALGDFQRINKIPSTGSFGPITKQFVNSYKPKSNLCIEKPVKDSKICSI